MPDIKEERIRKIVLSYYSRKDILEAMYNFSKNREISPRYFEGFGKRPDSFQYPSDIIAMVKNGATSFHCSEEFWSDPLELSTELSQEEINKLRIGWDLIIDIDCKWIDYSKKAAQAVIDSLSVYGVKDIGIKFSGSKGFHIIIPWESFPEEIDRVKTKEMFPEWARAILEYIKEMSRPRLAELIKNMPEDFAGIKEMSGIECKQCNRLASENYQITLKCINCKPAYIETFTTYAKDYKQKKCPECGKELKETMKDKFYVCNRCMENSLSNPKKFSESEKKNIFEILGIDLLLVSPRHLFRMPYSLHEKTSLVSAVIKKEKLAEFNIKDANPMNVEVAPFIPEVKKEQAKKLLIHAIDWYKTKEKKQENKSYWEGEKMEFEKIEVKNLKNEFYPPAILKILKGMGDGKKRALFILINFFRSIGYSIEEVEKKVNEWNKLNKPQLKQGYINSQIIWHSKNKIVLPPNFDNEIYKEIGVLEMDALSEKVKNPVSYVLKKMKMEKKFNTRK